MDTGEKANRAGLTGHSLQEGDVLAAYKDAALIAAAEICFFLLHLRCTLITSLQYSLL